MQYRTKERLKGLYFGLILSGTIIFFTTPAFAGGTHGGGGGTLPDTPVDAVFLTKEIPRMKPFVQMAVNYLDVLSLFIEVAENVPHNPDMDRVLAKLKPHFEDMFLRVKNEDFVVLTDRACKDSYNQEKDASVNDSQFPGKICISVKTLVKKLTYKNYFESVVGLLVHELTHLYGADEKDALTIQQLMGLYLSQNQRYGMLPSTFKYQVKNRLKEFEKLIEDSQTSGEGYICMRLSELAQKYSDLRYMPEGPLPGGSSMINAKSWKYFQLGSAQIHYAKTFCLELGSPEHQEANKDVKDNTIPATKVNATVFKNSSNRIIVVQPRDRKLLKAALVTAQQYMLVQKYQGDRIGEIEMPKETDYPKILKVTPK